MKFSSLLASLFLALSAAGWSTDIYYYPTPQLGSADTTDNIEILGLLHELGLNPILFVDAQSIPDQGWSLVVVIAADAATPKRRSCTILLQQKGGGVKATLEYDSDESPTSTTELRERATSMIRTFMPHG